MVSVVTINRPDVVALIEQAARKLTDGNKTKAVALAVRRLLEQDARAGSLFGALMQSCMTNLARAGRHRLIYGTLFLSCASAFL